MKFTRNVKSRQVLKLSVELDSPETAKLLISLAHNKSYYLMLINIARLQRRFRKERETQLFK